MEVCFLGSVSDLPEEGEPHVITLDGKYLCSLCNASFMHKSSCIRHFSVHQGTSMCPKCHKNLCHPNALKKHMLKHERACPACKDEFNTQVLLLRHLEFCPLYAQMQLQAINPLNMNQPLPQEHIFQPNFM